MTLPRSALVLLGLLPSLGGAAAQDGSLPVDDFGAGDPTGWWLSTTPEYYQGGEDRSGLAIVTDPERGRVLRAQVSLPDAQGREVAFLTRKLSSPQRMLAFAGVSFWYRLNTADLDPEHSLICRVRTSLKESWGQTSFMDMVVARPAEIVPGRWRHADLAFDPGRQLNVYSFFLETPGQITFRLQSRNGAKLQAELLLADIRLQLKPVPARDYQPQVRPRSVGQDTHLLLASQSAAGYYGIEEAARLLPGPVTVDRAWFRGLHLPLEGFPTTWAALAPYHALVFVDVDPFVMTVAQRELLADYVASGGGLLFCGGPNTLGHSVDFDPLVAALLPLRNAGAATLAQCLGPVSLVGKHPITEGLSLDLGSIASAHEAEPTPGASVLLSGPPSRPGGWGYYYGGGRGDAVVAASTDAHSGRFSAALVVRGFYRDPATGKESWHASALMGADTDGYTGPHAPLAEPGATYRLAFWLKGDVPTVRVEVLTWRTLEAPAEARAIVPTTIGTVTPTGEWQRYEGTVTLPAASRRYAVRFGVQGNPTNMKPGQRVLVDDLTVTREGSAQNLAPWGDAERSIIPPVLVAGTYHNGRVVALTTWPARQDAPDDFFGDGRAAEVLRRSLLWVMQRPITAAPIGNQRPAAPLTLSIRAASGVPAVEPGKTIGLRVMVQRLASTVWPGELAARLMVTDPWGKTVARLGPADFQVKPGAAEAEVTLPWSVPDLEEGRYRVTAEAPGVAPATAEVCVAAARDPALVYPVMGIAFDSGGGQTLDPEGLRRQVDNLLDHGINTPALPDGVAWPEAMLRGALSFNDYTVYTPIRPGEASRPCVFDPAFRETVRKRVQPQVASASLLPRYLSAKVIDEPYANRGNLDYCPYCQKEFERLYGRPLPRAEEIPADDAVLRREFNEFVAYYVAEAYRMTHEETRAAGAAYGLTLTYWPVGYSSPAWSMIQDVLGWGRYCERLDFDDYIYFYPASDRLRYVRAHHGFGYFREVARYLGKPWGYYVEVDDRNHPYRVTPKEASAEAAYTALAAGADYLNTFITVTFDTGSGARAERWEAFGAAMAPVNRVGPLLAALDPPPSPVVMIFPQTDQTMTRDRGHAETYTYEHLLRAFGPTDLADERIIRDRGLAGRRAVVLVNTQYLNRKTRDLLVDFVRQGGLLVVDEVPALDEEARPLEWPEGMFGGGEQPLAPSLPFRSATVGRGKTVLLGFPLEKTLHDSVEAADGEQARQVVGFLREQFAACGARPLALCDDPDVEAGLLAGARCAVVVAVDHHPDPAETTVTVRPGFVPTVALDLATGKPVPFAAQGDAVTFGARLAGRSGRMIAFYPKAVARWSLRVAPQSVAPGATLRMEVRALDGDGAAVPGQNLLAVTVTDPSGSVHPAYGGTRATDGEGLCTMTVPVPLNAPSGAWKVAVRGLFAGQPATAQFGVAAGH